MNATVRYDRRNSYWYFGEERRRDDGAGALIVKRNDLALASATDFARAFREAWRQENWPHAVLVDLAPDDVYDPKNTVVDGTSFVLHGDSALAVQCSLVSDVSYDDDEQLRNALLPLLGPLLRRLKAKLAAAEVDGNRSSPPYYHRAVITMNSRGKTAGQLYEIGESVTRLIDAATTGELARETVADLIIGGRADLLVGQPEGPWLDVKSDHYDLTTGRGQISLAQAVSRFANAEEGGVVVVGMATKRVAGGEVIRSIKPVPIDKATVRRYRQIVEGRLFPFPTALSIQAVETSAGEGLVVISLPPQEEELKPFLVHGAIVEGHVEGAYISIVRRSGEDSIPITAQQIHSTLAAGRALLRRGVVPPIE